MTTDDFERLALDLQVHGRFRVEYVPARSAEELHVLRIEHLELFFFADGRGYDGWGMAIPRDVPPEPLLEQELAKLPRMKRTRRKPKR